MRQARMDQNLIIEIPAGNGRALSGSDVRRRDVDPFIAKLITKLQAEVRRERASQRAPRPLQSEAEITWRDAPLEFTEVDFDAWERGAWRLIQSERSVQS